MEIFLKDAFKISILLNPFAVLSTFIALTGSRTSGQRLRIMIHTCLAALAAGAVVLFSGNIIFSLIDINLNRCARRIRRTLRFPWCRWLFRWRSVPARLRG